MSYTLNTPYPTTTLFLNSKNCISRQSETGGVVFRYYLKQSIRPPINGDMILSVITATIPNMINNVTNANNKLSFFSEFYGNYTVVILNGIYNVYEFVSYINTQLEGINITCSYNNFKLTFQSTHKFRIIDIEGYETSCGGLIGLEKDSQNNFSYKGLSSYVYTCPSYINFSGTPHVFIKVEGISLTNLNSNGENDGTLVRIPVNCKIGEMIIYNSTDIVQHLITSDFLQYIDLSLEDCNDNLINIGSLDFQIQLKVDIIYKPEMKSLEEGTIQHTLRIQQMTEDTPQEVNNEDGLGI